MLASKSIHRFIQINTEQLNVRASLETGLRCGGCMLALNVDNGTEWLQLGGDDHSFGPIVTARLQAVASSDLSLVTALTTVREQRKGEDPLGVYIHLAENTITDQALEVISTVFQADM